MAGKCLEDCCLKVALQEGCKAAEGTRGQNTTRKRQAREERRALQALRANALHELGV